MKTVAFINARRDSDRLPDKHLLEIGNQSLILHVVDYARSNKIDEVIVSTNCLNIKNTCKKEWVTILDRPEALCEERLDVSVEDECRAVNEWNLKEYQRLIGNTDPIRVAKFHGNSLILRDDLFERALRVLDSTGAARVRSFYKLDAGHPYNSYKINDGIAVSHLGIWNRGQEFPPLYACDDGVDISYWPPKVDATLAAVITEPGDVCHIHTRRDYEIACALVMTTKPSVSSQKLYKRR